MARREVDEEFRKALTHLSETTSNEQASDNEKAEALARAIVATRSIEKSLAWTSQPQKYSLLRDALNGSLARCVELFRRLPSNATPHRIGLSPAAFDLPVPRFPRDYVTDRSVEAQGDTDESDGAEAEAEGSNMDLEEDEAEDASSQMELLGLCPSRRLAGEKEQDQLNRRRRIEQRRENVLSGIGMAQEAKERVKERLRSGDGKSAHEGNEEANEEDEAEEGKDDSGRNEKVSASEKLIVAAKMRLLKEWPDEKLSSDWQGNIFQEADGEVLERAVEAQAAKEIEEEKKARKAKSKPKKTTKDKTEEQSDGNSKATKKKAKATEKEAKTAEKKAKKRMEAKSKSETQGGDVDIEGKSIEQTEENNEEWAYRLKDEDIIERNVDESFNQFIAPFEVQAEGWTTLHSARQKLIAEVAYPLMSPQIWRTISPKRAFLLCGNEGTGKTKLIRSIAHDANAMLVRLDAGAIDGLNSMGSDAEEEISIIVSNAKKHSPAVIHLEEAECLLHESRTEQGEGTDEGGGDEAAASQSVRQMLTRALKKLGRGDRVVLMGETSKPWECGAKPTRALFDEKACVPLPMQSARRALTFRWLGGVRWERASMVAQASEMMSPLELRRVVLEHSDASDEALVEAVEKARADAKGRTEGRQAAVDKWLSNSTGKKPAKKRTGKERANSEAAPREKKK